MENKKRYKALDWWRKLSDGTQQDLQAKYYPEDDFIVTDRSSLRIETIWYKEKHIKKHEK